MHRAELRSFLPEEYATDARRTLFRLTLENGYLREAFDVWRLMELRGDEEGLGLYRETYEQLVAFRANDEAYGVGGHIDERGSWGIQLFKDSFYFDRLTGSVAS